MTQPQDQMKTSATTAESGVGNPWLIAALALAIGVFLTGMGLYNGDDPEHQVVGVWLIGAGAIAAALWLTAGAICWQLKRR